MVNTPTNQYINIHSMFRSVPCWRLGAGSDHFHEEIGTSTVGYVGLLIRSTIGIPIPSSVCTRKHDEDFTDGISSPERSEQVRRRRRRAATVTWGGEERKGNIAEELLDTASRGLTTFVTPKPHFRTNPSDHGKASSNIVP
ncbi:hypothetical protein F511_40181 [Dorcoceras hygrometricum]|uniref:Uncharacterized protein n=1 Tax=Dorcoceras hygrometricum TaxID=472368 RepID=A0A2Z7DAR6_9LAMI|nr:hypothetical protein F511_40181 [Dorcoceras hygrometricum]